MGRLPSRKSSIGPGGMKRRDIGRNGKKESPEALRQQLFLGVCQRGGETLPIVSGAD